MPPDTLQTFRLGPWTVEPLRGIVRGQNGETQHLEPKVMDVFVCLAENVNEIVSRKQLLDAAWSGSTGSDEQLTRAIGELRRAFHDSPGDSKFIETIPKRGYRLIGVSGNADVDIPASDSALPRSTSRFAGSKLVIFASTILTLGLVYVAFDEATVGSVPDVALTSGQSIAVLPFVNMSDDPLNDYFSDGLSEEILTLLARINDLKVIGRTSSFAFKGKNEDIRVIGQRLGVKAVLEGSVRRTGDRVRITAQLVDASDGSYIWSDSYDRTMTDIFAVQDDIAAAIIDALKMHVGTNPTRGRPTAVVEAYALFLKARVLLNIQETQTAESILLQATELDPGFAEAHELLAHLYWMQDIPGIPMDEARALMQGSATRALAIDSDLVFARALYELGHADNHSMPGAISALLSAARERPNDPAILRTLTWELLITGYLNEALRAAERFVEVDPLSSIAHIRYCAALRAVGRVNESIAALKVAASLTPSSLDWYFGEFGLAEKHDDAAIEYFEAYLGQTGITDVSWIEDLVTNGRDEATGQAHLDERIPVTIQSLNPGNPTQFQDSLNRWYLFFGHLDRYFELVLGRIAEHSTQDGSNMYLWYGTLNRDQGFTAHPKYLEVAAMSGLIGVWEQLGPPDFCSKINGTWICE